MNTRVILALPMLLLLISCDNKPEEKPEPQARSFPVVKLVNQDVTGFYTFPAIITGKNNNQVRAKISGYMKKRFIDEGQQVKKGDPLFELETNILDENEVAAKSQILTAEAGIEAAKAGVTAAQVEVNKLIPLVKKNIISGVPLETARANFLKAKGELSRAQANHEIAIANHQGIIENLKFSTVKSPIDGIIGKLNYREGALISPLDPMPLTTVSDASEIYAYFSIVEKQFIYFFQNFPGTDLAEKISLVPPIDLELADGSIYNEKGKVETSTGQIDPNTGTIQFRVKFANENGLLSNGSSGSVKIPRVYEDVLAVPESALFEQQGINYVYKLDDNASVVATVVKLRDHIQNMALIDEGLTEGDSIVVAGVSKIKNGEVIEPEETDIKSVLSKIKTVN